MVLATGSVPGITDSVPGLPKGSGGPPGGATYPGGPHGLKWEGNQPLVGWCAPLGPPSAPRVGNPRGGGASTCPGGQVSPLGHHPPRRSHLLGPTPPLGSLYKEGGAGRAAAPNTMAPPSPPCYTSSSRSRLAKPCRNLAASTTTPPCYWIFINLSFPLAGSRRRRCHADRTCVERGGAVRSALGSPVIWITMSTTTSSPFF